MSIIRPLQNSCLNWQWNSKETGVHIGFINLSGGVGVPYLPDQEGNDIAVIGEGVHKAFDEVLVPAGMGDVKNLYGTGPLYAGTERSSGDKGDP